METNIPEGYQQTDAGVIPDDWIAKKLGDIGKFKNGINKAKEEFGFGYPFVNLLDIFGGASLSNKSSFGLVNSTQQERSEYDLKKGDVLFVRSSVKPEGVGLTSVITEDLKDSVYSGFLIRFRDFDLLNLGYKEYCFYEEGFRKRLIDNSTVSANTNINQDALKSLVVAFPSTIEEQKAIAQALSDVDAAIAELDRLITKKRNIKQGAMQQLLTGKKRLPGFSGEWEVKTFRDVSFVNQGLQIAIEKRLKQPALNSKKYITIQFLNNGKDVEYINGYSSSVCCKENDVLMTRTGNTGIVVSGVSGVFHNNFFKINFDRKAIDKNYLIGYLNLDKTHKLILAKAGTSTIPDLNHNDFYSIPIPLPTLSEQEAIAQVLTDMDAEIEALEQKRDKYKAIKQGMMQELLTGRTRLV